MRSRATSYLTDSCAIYYVTYTSDGMGGETASWTARGTNIACYLASASGREMAASGDRMEAFTFYTLHLASSQTIIAGDKVVLDSRTYRVETVLEADTARATIQAALTLED